MKYLFACLLFVFCFVWGAHAQNITSFAGNGTITNDGDSGPATAAGIYYPVEGVFDKWGNYYFVEGLAGYARKISATGIITTFAGNVLATTPGDGGPATMAELNNPQGIAVDTAGNVYIAEQSGNRIRRVDILTNIITTIAGNGISGYNGDSIPATAAQIYSPGGICFNQIGELFIADYGNVRVRKIDTYGTISTVAGTGTYTGGYIDGGLATSTMIRSPCDVCTDAAGNLYIADWYSRVLKVDAAGIITTFAGGSIDASTGDGLPATDASTVPFKIQFDQHGNLFIAEYDVNKVRMVSATTGIITTIAGTGTAGFSGDGHAATACEMNHPAGLNFDSCGNLYICDTHTYYIREVLYNPTCGGTVDTGSLNAASVMPAQINICPNPAGNELHIDEVQGAATYHLLSMVGSIIQQGTLKQGSNTLLLYSLPAGMYLLELTDNEGNRKVRRVVKQ